MSSIKNEGNKVDEKIGINRAQIEHRATWMGLIYDEMTKIGIDAEPILRKAIRRCGNIHGDMFKKMCKDPSNLNEFEQVFFNEIGVNTFNMKNITSDNDNATSEFNYCALVNAWQKLGFDDATCDKLCDIAMDGDRGIADAMGMKLDLNNTIAKCNKTCDLHFHK